MEKLLEKITSYNIFNYLLPGAVFSMLAKLLDIVDFPKAEIIGQIFWFYFVGMTISRVGSVVVEPLYRRSGFLKYSNYESYLQAQKSDPNMNLMVESANSLRTITAMLILVILGLIANIVSEIFSISERFRIVTLLVLLIVLFSFALRKQVSFIRKRISHFEKGSQ